MLLLDPAASEEAHSEASCTMALMPSCNEVTQLEMKGQYSDVCEVDLAAGSAHTVRPFRTFQGCWGDHECREALELCMGACMSMKAAMREALIQAGG